MSFQLCTDADPFRIAFAPGQPLINSSEAVPFRLTPNMQHFATRAGVEGVITGTCTAMARCLTAPEFDLSGTLSLFIRDEVRSIVVRPTSSLLTIIFSVAAHMAQYLHERLSFRKPSPRSRIQECGQLHSQSIHHGFHW